LEFELSAQALVLAPIIGFVGMFAGGFWGVGCGWLIVPSALYFFDCTPMQAAGIGLLQTVPSILFPTLREAPKIGWGRNSVGRNLVLPMALGSLATSFWGLPINSYFHRLCGSRAIFIFFGVFMFVVGLQTLFGKARRYGDETPLNFSGRSLGLATLGGLGAGVFSSVLGVGGAMVFRPVLANGFKTTETETARCVRFLLLTTTSTGGIDYLFAQGAVDYKILILTIMIAAGGALGFPLGMRAHRIVVAAGYESRARRSFAIICGTVFVNVVLTLIGFYELSRLLMFAAAIGLFAYLNLFAYCAKKRNSSTTSDRL